MLHISAAMASQFDTPYITDFCEDLRYFLMSEGVAPLALLESATCLMLLQDFVTRLISRLSGYDREMVSRLSRTATLLPEFWDANNGVQVREWLLGAPSTADMELRIEHLIEEGLGNA